MTGFWAGIVLGQAGTVLAVSIFAWRKAGRISFSPEIYCRFNPDFGVDPAHIWEYHITNKDTAMAASMEVFDFCKKNGLDPDTCMLISLCMEEISTNVVDYGFDEKQGVNPLKTRHLDTCVIIEENRKLICFRDDCDSFDPTKYLKLNQDSDPFTHIGIRMILGMVKEANYVNSFGLNILTLVL